MTTTPPLLRTILITLMMTAGNFYCTHNCLSLPSSSPPPPPPPLLSHFSAASPDEFEAATAGATPALHNLHSSPQPLPSPPVARMRPTSSKQHRPPSARRRPQRSPRLPPSLPLPPTPSHSSHLQCSRWLQRTARDLLLPRQSQPSLLNPQILKNQRRSNFEHRGAQRAERRI
jgi:hypothetical protein